MCYGNVNLDFITFSLANSPPFLTLFLSTFTFGSGATPRFALRGVTPFCYQFCLTANYVSKVYVMTTLDINFDNVNTVKSDDSKPISDKQRYRIQTMIDRNIINSAMPDTSWEASFIIRTAPASKKDKELLRVRGGRVVARMTVSELETANRMLEVLDTLRTSKTSEALDASSLIRRYFTNK